MTSKARVLEAMFGAESLVEGRLMEALGLLHRHNEALRAAVVRIRDIQGEGCKKLLQLDLEVCRSELCAGCPHPRWRSYEYHPGAREGAAPRLQGTCLDSKNLHPILVIPKRAPYRAELVRAVRQTVLLIERRTLLINALRDLHQQVTVNKLSPLPAFAPSPDPTNPETSC